MARRLTIAVVASVVVVVAFGVGAVLELWHDYLAVRLVVGLAYSLVGAVVGYVVGTRRRGDGAV